MPFSHYRLTGHRATPPVIAVSVSHAEVPQAGNLAADLFGRERVIYGREAVKKKLFAGGVSKRAVYERHPIDVVLFMPCGGAVLMLGRIIHIVLFSRCVACVTGAYTTIRINLFIGTLLYSTLRYYTLLYYGVIVAITRLINNYRCDNSSITLLPVVGVKPDSGLSWRAVGRVKVHWAVIRVSRGS